MSSATSQNDHTAMHVDDLYELISDAPAAANHQSGPSNGEPRDGHYLFPNHVVAESLQDLLINTSQWRGLAGSGSASLVAGYLTRTSRWWSTPWLVTAASRPRGTLGPTPRDLPALCPVKAHDEGCTANSWTRVCY
jgi:hypothetical protein